MAKPNLSLTLAVLTVLFIAGCTPVQPGNSTDDTYTPPEAFEPSGELDVKTFGSEQELRDFLEQYDTSGGTLQYRALSTGVAMDNAVAESAPAPQAPGAKVAGDGAERDFSGTNVQVQDIDEADIIKTDGEYIYTVTGQTLFIIHAYPGADAAVVAAIELPGNANGLFVEGDNLAVMGYFYDNDYFADHDIRPMNGMTYLTLYDISDRSEPVEVNDYKFDGTYFDARMENGELYVLVQSQPYSVQPLPIILEGDVKRTMAAQDIAYFPMPYDYPQFVTIHSLPIGDGELRSRTITVEGGNTLYQSADNIYIAYTKYISEWDLRSGIMKEVLEPRLTAEERTLIQKIAATDSDVLSPAEKESKILQVYQEHVQFLRNDEQEEIAEEIDARLKEKLMEYEALEYTVIHKIDTESLAVVANGEVPGRLNNQFAMDERDGYLRVATTVSQRWSSWAEPMPTEAVATDEAVARDAEAGSSAGADVAVARMIAPPRAPSESRNNVYVLDESLAMVGELTDLAEGEQIYSTRFIDERLYMVTFRQVDPFFVIDLSDPQNPTTLGELKIPGFSRYLHPYDENTIIGIGRDATELGRQQGLKISLFDVSDVSNPEEVAQWISDEQHAQSEAEWQHHAFLFDREKELLVIPAYSYDWESRGGREQYNGAMVFHIERDDIELRGIVDHASGRTQHYGQLVERSLFIEELLYTKSPNLLRINQLDDLSSVQNVTLSESTSSPYPIY